MIRSSIAFFGLVATTTCAEAFVVPGSLGSLSRLRAREIKRVSTLPRCASSPSSAAEGRAGVVEQKVALMDIIRTTRMGTRESQQAAEEVDTLIEGLEGLNEGFKEDAVDGEWQLCFTRNSDGSPSLQKALSGDVGFQNFDVRGKTFQNVVKLLGGLVKVLADVAYTINPARPNRLEATIIGAGIKFGPLPRLPLPLTGRVGYLEFVYQDEDIRVTRGNRGGLFLHARPESFLAKS
ncbi:unnamed protein product [Discosporangium mesarthrocarpum]